MASPGSLKRSYDEARLEEPLYVRPMASAQTPQSAASGEHREEVEQASATSQASLAPAVSQRSSPRTADGLIPALSVVTTQTSAKKQGVASEEKEVKRAERELKAREKADEKAKKEEEKRAKNAAREEEKNRKQEGKRAKDAAKEERRKAKEHSIQAKQEEKRLKEEEKQKQEDERNKKSRNQLRLNSFFAMPSMSNGRSSGSPTRDAQSPLSSRRSSISEIQAMEAPRRSRSVSVAAQKPQLSDYEREIKPFYVPAYTSLAPYNRFSRDERNLSFVRDKIDADIKVNLEAKPARTEQGGLAILELLQLPPYKARRRLPPRYSVKEIMQEIEGTTTHPIDLTGQQTKKVSKTPLDLLGRIPMKFLKFREDVRPPYIGTYTHLQDALPISRLARKPFCHSLPDTNYDYDSEAEWEEPAEGEDLVSEGEEESEDEEDGDDMAEFLDDKGANDVPRPVNRRPMLGNQEPVCTGICWEGPHGQAPHQAAAVSDLRPFKMDVLMENPQLPIDPYCATYWTPTTQSTFSVSSTHAQGTLMEPPRYPLHPINRHNALSSASPLMRTGNDLTLNSSSPMKPAKVQRLIAPELMDEFKAVVQGNDLTKLGLLEILKKKFPKQPKDAIKDTLETIAERVGSRPSEKKWALKSGV